MLEINEFKAAIQRSAALNPVTVDYNTYHINNEIYSRVTSTLGLLGLNKNILEKWKQKVIKNRFITDLEKELITKYNAIIKMTDALSEPDNVLKQASKLGTASHEQFQKFLEDHSYMMKGNSPVCNKILDSFCAFAYHPDWNLRTNYKLVGCEIPLFSRTHHYAGTMDCLMMRDNKYYIFDWKTSNHVHVTYLLQLAAYWKAVEEMFDVKIEEAYIVDFKKDGSFPQIVPLKKEQLDYFFTQFLYLICLQSLGDIKL